MISVYTTLIYVPKSVSTGNNYIRKSVSSAILYVPKSVLIGENHM